MRKLITAGLSRASRALKRFRKLYRLAKGYQAKRPLRLAFKMWWRGDDQVPLPTVQAYAEAFDRNFKQLKKELYDPITGVNEAVQGKCKTGRLSATERNESNFKKGGGADVQD